jgi:PAS domain S-box-containing protein
VALSVFAAETLVMLPVHALEPYLPVWVEFLLDATVLVVLVSPALFVLVFRPLATQIEAQDRAEAELQRAQEALAERARASDEALAAVFQASPVPLVALTPEGNVSLWNRAAEAVFGWSADEVVNQPYPLVPPGREAEFRGLLARALQGERLPGVEVRRQRKDGTLLDLRVWTAPLHDAAGIVTGILAVVVDVSERRHAEERLRLQGAALEAAANAVMITDREGTILWANDAFSRLTGWSLDECRGRTPRILKSGRHDRLFYEELWRTILGARVWQHEMVNRRKDGELYIEDQTITPVTDERGEVTHFVAVKIDIGERKRTEAAILKEKAFSEAMINSLPGIFYLFDQTGRFLRWNHSFESVSGYSAGEIASMHPLDFFSGEDRTLLEQRIRTVFETGAADAEAALVSKDGRRTPHYFVGVRLAVDGAPCCIGMGIDVTARKQLEEQLRQAQKMEAIGQLAGGVAHDFNNILSVIGGYSELVLRSLPSGDPQRRRLEQIRNAGERAAALTHQLLAFGRKQALTPTVLDVAEAVSGMEGMLRRLIPEGIQVVTVFGAEAGRVRADRGQIEQVILNLAVNARDAMPDGGRLVIETLPADLDEGYCRSHAAVRPGRYVLLAVSDTGIGMDAETQTHVFEPFFTTKELGKGTGLGLSTTYGIVKQHEGHITIYSEPGRGTTFKVYLPRVDQEAAREEVATTPPQMARANETILLVEDEEAVRLLNREVLEELGYAVLDARDGEAALELSQRHAGRLHLLLTDMVMPRMTGRQLAERLRASRPELRVLFVSGYTSDVVARSGGLEPGMAFLQKPFTPDQLARKLRELLEEPREVAS